MLADPVLPEFRRLFCRRTGGTLRAADIVEGTLQLGGAEHVHPPELRGPWHQVDEGMARLCVDVRYGEEDRDGCR